VILTINPEAIVVDICNSVEPQNIWQAAFLSSAAYHYFPEGTIHVVVIDPGVGSQRKTIILKIPVAFFVTPDNSVLSYILDELCPSFAKQASFVALKLEQKEIGSTLEAVTITNPDFWRQPVSTAFHGRDLFAPVAANLSSGVALHNIRESIGSLFGCYSRR